jgi:hypothetical protein
MLKFNVSVAIGLIGVSQFCHAGELHIYEHNRSVIDWVVVGDTIKATYSKPRPDLEAAGIKEGQLLFDGVYEGERISGTAYAFKSGCSPAAYQVIGTEERGKITLRGPAPTRSRTNCRVLGYSATSPHAKLVFVYSSTHH